MEMPPDPFSDAETDAVEWNALKVLPLSDTFLANPQPDVPLPAPWPSSAVGTHLTPEMLAKALDELWRGPYWHRKA
jgi:hypothetical protein